MRVSRTALCHKAQILTVCRIVHDETRGIGRREASFSARDVLFDVALRYGRTKQVFGAYREGRLLAVNGFTRKRLDSYLDSAGLYAENLKRCGKLFLVFAPESHRQRCVTERG